MDIFAKRRAKLKRMMGVNSMAILPSAPVVRRNKDVDYVYRQSSDFYYLSGFTEGDAVLVLMPGRAQGEYLLFCREHDQLRETWEGKRAGLEGACTLYQANDAFPITDIEDILPDMMEGKRTIYYSMGLHQEFDHVVMDCLSILRERVRSGVQVPSEFVSLENILHEMRMFKSTEEIDIMRQAANISSAAHEHAMKICQPGLYEYQIEAEISYQCAMKGARQHAYPPIVATGGNACTLHYTENNAICQSGDLLLIDAGAEYQYYASDITRTFPVNGKFSEPQRQLYEIVLAAQLAAIAEVVPGKSWADPHNTSVRVITEGLIALGILTGNCAELIDKKAYATYYLHRVGHWLGLDVHDVGEYKIDQEWRYLKPGMVMTVEPGIYIPKGSATDPKWWDIGIRIEDDILVTENGNEVLSNAVKSIADIEQMMHG